MARPTVYVARNIPAKGLRMLKGIAELRIHPGQLPASREELLSGVRGCEAILSLLSDRIDQDVFDAAGKQLKVVSNYAVGFNNIDVAAAERCGVAVGNTPDVLTDATADIAIGLLLVAARRMQEAACAVRDGAWKTWEPLGWIGRDLQNSTLGVIGMGRIGGVVARRMQAGWNMRVLYTSRAAKPDINQELKAEHVQLEQLLRESDFVSVHVPLTAETTKLLSSTQFQLMKPTAVLVNTARGEIVDQIALEIALREGQIFAAGLDVCTPEPLPADSGLRNLSNCFILPHIGSATVEARNAMAERAAQNIIAGLEGRCLPFPVNEKVSIPR